MKKSRLSDNNQKVKRVLDGCKDSWDLVACIKENPDLKKDCIEILVNDRRAFQRIFGFLFDLTKVCREFPEDSYKLLNFLLEVPDEFDRIVCYDSDFTRLVQCFPKASERLLAYIQKKPERFQSILGRVTSVINVIDCLPLYADQILETLFKNKEHLARVIRHNYDYWQLLSNFTLENKHLAKELRDDPIFLEQIKKYLLSALLEDTALFERVIPNSRLLFRIMATDPIANKALFYHVLNNIILFQRYILTVTDLYIMHQFMPNQTHKLLCKLFGSQESLFKIVNCYIAFNSFNARFPMHTGIMFTALFGHNSFIKQWLQSSSDLALADDEYPKYSAQLKKTVLASPELIEHFVQSYDDSRRLVMIYGDEADKMFKCIMSQFELLQRVATDTTILVDLIEKHPKYARNLKALCEENLDYLRSLMKSTYSVLALINEFPNLKKCFIGWLLEDTQLFFSVVHSVQDLALMLHTIPEYKSEFIQLVFESMESFTKIVKNRDDFKRLDKDVPDCSDLLARIKSKPFSSKTNYVGLRLFQQGTEMTCNWNYIPEQCVSEETIVDYQLFLKSAKN